MTHNVRSIYQRMNKMLLTIPPNIDIKMNEEGRYQTTILNVMSIEEEWIIDNDLRNDISLVHFKK